MTIGPLSIQLKGTVTFLGIAKKEGKERRNGGMSERKKERKKEIKKR